MKFVLLVEGKTEHGAAAAFLKRWLDPQLQQRVGIQPVEFDGYADLTRKMVTKAHMYLNGPKHTEVICVIGLLDLYGPDFYPKNITIAEDRIDWGKKHFEELVNHERFRMFFAVHEFEAWLLSQPEIFKRDIQLAIQDKATRPEQVNFDEPPAKLLNRVYQSKTNRNYKKTTYGKQLFEKLDPAVAREKCPHLKIMLDEMLSLAKKAGL